MCTIWFGFATFETKLLKYLPFLKKGDLPLSHFYNNKALVRIILAYLDYLCNNFKSFKAPLTTYGMQQDDKIKAFWKCFQTRGYGKRQILKDGVRRVTV